MRRLAPLLCLIAAPVSAASDAGSQAVGLIAGTAGKWLGALQYRDYQSNTWQGLPVTVTVVKQPDDATMIRTALYDDGPQTGIVTITTVTLVDPAASTMSYAIFRKNRPTDSGSTRIHSVAPGKDDAHWTIVTIETRKDGDSLAQVRETTSRDGDTLTTLKEVDPVDDGKDDWQPRNRTVLQRIAS